MPQFRNDSELLRAARKHLNLTQEEFARDLGIKLSRYQKWERGASRPRFSIGELRRIRHKNRRIFEALVSGFLLVPLNWSYDTPTGLKQWRGPATKR